MSYKLCSIFIHFVVPTHLNYPLMHCATARRPLQFNWLHEWMIVWQCNDSTDRKYYGNEFFFLVFHFPLIFFFRAHRIALKMVFMFRNRICFCYVFSSFCYFVAAKFPIGLVLSHVDHKHNRFHSENLLQLKQKQQKRRENKWKGCWPR